MKPVLVAIAALALLPAASRAQESPAGDLSQFRSLADTIKADPSTAGQWVDLLPTIARQCDMVVDHKRVTVLVDAFDSPEAVDEAADFFAARPESRLRVAWDAIAKRDQDEACRLADGLWGEAGTVFPGVLRDASERPGPMISQHAAHAETR